MHPFGRAAISARIEVSADDSDGVRSVPRQALVQIAGARESVPCCAVEDFKLGARHSTPQAQSRPWTPRRPSPNCPLRMRCINSIPAIVIAAVAKALEAQHRGDSLFHAPMVLLDQIVQVLRRPQLRLGRQQAIGFQLTHRAVRRGIAVQSDRPGSIVLALDRASGKNALAAATSRLAPQPEVNRPPRPIHGTIEIAPFASNFDVCLVHPPEPADRLGEPLPALLRNLPVRIATPNA